MRTRGVLINGLLARTSIHHIWMVPSETHQRLLSGCTSRTQTRRHHQFPRRRIEIGVPEAEAPPAADIDVAVVSQG